MMTERTVRRWKLRRGSIALDAALALPPVLILILFFLSDMLHESRKLTFVAALDNTAQEISLALPVAEAINASDLLLDGNPTLGLSLPGWLAHESGNIVTGSLIRKRLLDWLDEADAHMDVWGKAVPRDSIQIELAQDPFESTAWLVCTYQSPLLGRRITVREKAAIPAWRVPRIEQVAESDAADGIWLLDNFSRGSRLREIFKANLPHDFPVLASWSGGTATRLTSMDLTAPTYQDLQDLETEVADQVSRLSQFKGAAYHREGETIAILSSEIMARRMVLVVPRNYDTKRIGPLLSRLALEASAQGVDLVVRPYGASQRYQLSGNDPGNGPDSSS